jgi:hypothetical protein
MIAIVLLMLRHRWRRALTLCALATFTYGVAVAVPAYVAAADRAMIADEIGHASIAELSVASQANIDVSHGRDRTFESSAPLRLSQPWLATTFAVAVNVDTAPVPPGDDPTAVVPQMVYRQDYCAHVRLTAGRCPLTAGEVLISPDLAALLHVTVGDDAPLWWAYIGPAGWVASPDRMSVSIVGVYRPADASDTYWGGNAYFSDSRMAPILTERGTIDALSHGGETQTVDAVLRPGAITDATIGRTRSWIASVTAQSGTDQISTRIPETLDRIDADRRTLREVLPDGAAALIVIACFVLFLAAAYAVGDRAGELGVIRLRGVWAPDRWWLGAGESLLPVLLGVPSGLVVGGALATGAAAATLGTTGAITVTGGTLGGATIAAMIVAVLSAHVRPLAAPVADLLRRVPARVRGWRAATAQAVVASLAAVSVAQLHLQPGPLTGIMLIAPALIVVALGLLAGSAVLPPAGALGRRAVASPRRLGSGLGAISLARRPGTHLLLAVQVIALGLAGFAAADATAAAHARADWVALDLGAARVIDTGAVRPADLLREVRAADPTGRYAMAVVDLPPREAADPPVIALDAPRLPTVAAWPRQATVAASAVAAALHPPPAEAPRITGTAIALTLDTSDYGTELGDSYDPSAAAAIGVYATVVPASGTPITVDLGDLRLGPATLRATVPACATGCAFGGLTLRPRTADTMRLDTVVSGLTADGVAVPLPWTDGSRWRVTGQSDHGLPPDVAGDTDGLDVSQPELATVTGGLGVSLVDGPASLPAVSTTATGTAATGTTATTAAAGPAVSVGDADGQPIRAAITGPAAGTLPGVGTRGLLVDLEYLIRADTVNPDGAEATAPGQVWLAAGTPPAVLDALSRAGVVALADRTSASELSYLDRQGPALGVGFEVAAAGAAVLLATVCVALMAGIERGGRAAELRTLRVQGLSPASVRRAATASHLGPIALALPTGAAVAACAWWLTGRRLPVFASGDHAGLPPTSAPWWALLAAVGVGAAVIGVGAAVAARGLSRRANGG